MVNSRSLAISCIPEHQNIEHRQQVWKLIARRVIKPIPPQKIMFVGSSIFRLWKTLEADLYPLPIFNQAFGGSRTWEVLYYADKLIIPYQPKIIVYYCGSNDINAGTDAEGIARRFQMFFEYVQSHLPQTLVFFVSINRAPQKQFLWHVVDAANSLIKQYADATSYLEFINVNHALFDDLNQPRLDLFMSDRVHFKPAAYQAFTEIIKPVLQDAWNEMH